MQVTEDGNEPLLSANYMPAISPTVSLNITKATLLRQQLVEAGLLDIPGAPSTTLPTSLVMLISLLSLDTTLATILARAQTLLA